MDDLMVIKGNDHVWSKKERDEIIDRAAEIYLQKKRKACLDKSEQAPLEKRRIGEDVWLVDEDDNSNPDSENNPSESDYSVTDAGYSDSDSDTEN